MEGFKGR